MGEVRPRQLRRGSEDSVISGLLILGEWGRMERGAGLVSGGKRFIVASAWTMQS